VTRAVERVARLQAQWANSPYIALWSRVEGFERDQLTRSLQRRAVVKATLMRLTLHIVTAADYPYLAVAFREPRTERFARELAKHAPDLDPVEITARALARMGDRPRRRAEYFAAVGEDPSARPAVLRPWLIWMAIQAHGDLVHVPPSGTWGYFGSPSFVPAPIWLRQLPAVDGDARVQLVRRYLSAFGPASAADLASWSGARNLRPALQALEPDLRLFRDESSRLLYDLRRAPLLEPDTPAPVRFLPKWDTSIMGYAPPERWRILPERHRKTVIKVNGDVAQTFLVDGFIAGTWDVERKRGGATLRLSPFGPLRRDVRAELEDEGERLLRFVEPDAGSYSVL